MEYWVIRHKPSNIYFPLSSRGGKRGSTYIDLPFDGIPRLFTKLSAAKTTLKWWLGGKAIKEYDDGCIVGMGKGNSDRIKDDMEIIKIKLKEIKND